jgi:tetraacyldisaccharide 4'-kinase
MQHSEARITKPVGKKTNNAEAYLLSVIRGRPGATAAVLRFVLACLAPLYCIGLEIYLLPYAVGIRKRYRLKRPVICIGNLTTGGTGKTPMTQTICRMLVGCGLHPAVLSRGYGGEHEYSCAVVSDAERVYLTSAQAGDEAFLLASSLPGVPVVVGKDRRVTGALAIERYNPDVIVLDDGMQFWQLHRDLDIVLLNASHPFDNGYTFPRGLLREPKSHLKRAGVVIVTGVEAAAREELDAARTEALKIVRHVSLLSARLVPTGLRSVTDEVEYSTSWLNGKHAASLCAIGNPDSFEKMLQGLCARVEPRFRFRDHQAVGALELDRVLREAAASGAQALVITEKDAARMRFSDSCLPVLALQVSTRIDRESELEATLIKLVGNAKSERYTNNV